MKFAFVIAVVFLVIEANSVARSEQEQLFTVVGSLKHLKRSKRSECCKFKHNSKPKC